MSVRGIDTAELLAGLGRLARRRAAGESLWKDITVLETVGSTQDHLAEQESRGAREGQVVISREQTWGRGRLGRSWFSAPGLGLYVSALLRPGDEPSGLVRYSLAGAVAACEALVELGAPAEIKWPNDLLISGRKVGGLLIEGRSVGGRTRAVIIGCGVNVAHAHEDFPPDLADGSTSLAIALGGAAPEMTSICALLLDRLDARYLQVRREGIAPLLARWRELSPSSMGRPIVVEEGQSRWQGTTAGVQEDGSLLVRDTLGEARALRHGQEIRIREATRCCY